MPEASSFSACVDVRPKLDGVQFTKLSQVQVQVLSQAFSLEELEKAVEL